MLLKVTLALCMLCFACPVLSFSQDQPGPADKLVDLPNGVLNKIDQRTGWLDRQLTRQTEKYLKRLSRQETRLKNKLYQADSNAAKKAFAGHPEWKYQAFSKDLHPDTARTNKVAANGGEYLPYVDSLQGSLHFLDRNPQLLSSPGQPAAVQRSLADLQELRYKLQDADEVKKYIQQRKQELKATIDQCIGNSTVKKYYDDYSKTAWYYGQQVKEYRNSLNDPDKVFRETLAVLNKLPSFRDFMVKNSLISRLFDMPADYGSPQALQGLQTRDQVQGLIQEQVSAGGPNAVSQLQSQLAAAHTQLDKLKDKLPGAGGSGGDKDFPDFTPNGQKTRSLLQRLEYGCNFQTARSDHFYPTTTDIGLSVGYRINDRSTVGIGASYKIGWGRGLNDVHFTNEGVGLRSFLDIRIKGNWFASGGYEYNLQYPVPASSQLSNAATWTRSGLIGISKMLSMGGKLVKKTKVQLLWDFLSYNQRPQTQAIKFRISYNF